MLALVARGKSNREIARELSISVKTVEYHVSNILVKSLHPVHGELGLEQNFNGVKAF